MFGHAQTHARGGVTPDLIGTALPLEGAPLAVPGPYHVASEPAFGSPGHVIYRPADLAPFPGKDTLPVVVWGNGGCAIDSTRYAGFLTTIASHGFLVLATAVHPGAVGGRATADSLRAAIDWAETENTRAGSPLNGKIALDRIAVMGQSCGGFMALELGVDPRVTTIGIFNSGVQGDPAGTVARLHGPVLLVNGHDRDFLMPWSEATFDAIRNLPAFYGARRNAGHTATVDHPGGGEWANVASSWARWQLKGDKRAARVFVGKDCGLCRDANWVTKSKNIKPDYVVVRHNRRMRDYWLSKLFFDLQQPALAAEFRAHPDDVMSRYQLDKRVKRAIAEHDAPFLAERTNAYLLRYYFFAVGMKDDEFVKRLNG